MKEQIKQFKKEKRELEQQIGELLRKFELNHGMVGSIHDYTEVIRNPAIHTAEDPNGAGLISRVKITCSL